MMTFGISTHGPYASWHTSLRSRKHRDFRHTLTYWVLGLWMFELMGWTLWFTLVAMWWLTVRVMPVVIKVVAVTCAAVAALLVAGWSMWRGHRYNRQERARDGGRSDQSAL